MANNMISLLKQIDFATVLGQAEKKYCVKFFYGTTYFHTSARFKYLYIQIIL